MPCAFSWIESKLKISFHKVLSPMLIKRKKGQSVIGVNFQHLFFIFQNQVPQLKMLHGVGYSFCTMSYNIDILNTYITHYSVKRVSQYIVLSYVTHYRLINAAKPVKSPSHLNSATLIDDSTGRHNDHKNEQFTLLAILWMWETWTQPLTQISRHPIILWSYTHRLTTLIVKEAHNVVLHSGIECTLREVRVRHWY